MIEIEYTSNPNVRNYYFSKALLKNGESLYIDKDSKETTPFMLDIFKIGNVKRVLLLPDMLFIEKQDEGDFNSLEPQIMAAISETQPFSGKQDTYLYKKIDALIESRIRPFLQKDGGNIDILNLENNILTIRFKGRCQGCPHAKKTFKNVIQNLIEKYFPQIVQIIREP